MHARGRRSDIGAEDSARLLRFFRGEVEGPVGLTIHDCLKQSDFELEARHDYIQWVFPSPQQSAFNGQAPLFDEAAAEEFRRDVSLQDQLLQCLERMLQFYDMRVECVAGTTKKRTAAANGRRSLHWAKIVLNEKAYSEFNIRNTILGSSSKFHNLLRLTRIMLSLKTAGLPKETMMLYRVLTQDLQEVVDIPDRTLKFWGEAVADIEFKDSDNDELLESKEDDEPKVAGDEPHALKRLRSHRWATRRKGKRRRKRLTRTSQH